MYGEMIDEMDAWVDALETDEVNFELQELAEEQAAEEVNAVWERMMYEFCAGDCSDLEASHYLGA